jgi:hypothetical protein
MIQVPLPQGNQFRRPLTGHSVASRSPTGSGSCSLGRSFLQTAPAVHPVGRCRSRGQRTAPHAALRSAHSENRRNGAKASRAKVSLAMIWLSAYYWTCLVNRLWVPTTMRSLALFEAADCTLNFLDFGSRYWIRCVGIGTREGSGPPGVPNASENQQRG